MHEVSSRNHQVHMLTAQHACYDVAIMKWYIKNCVILKPMTYSDASSLHLVQVYSNLHGSCVPGKYIPEWIFFNSKLRGYNFLLFGYLKVK